MVVRYNPAVVRDGLGRKIVAFFPYCLRRGFLVYLRGAASVLIFRVSLSFSILDLNLDFFLSVDWCLNSILLAFDFGSDPFRESPEQKSAASTILESCWD